MTKNGKVNVYKQKSQLHALAFSFFSLHAILFLVMQFFIQFYLSSCISFFLYSNLFSFRPHRAALSRPLY